MATIKIKFRPSTVSDHEGTLYYQITHQRRVRQLTTDYHIFNTEWNSDRSTVASAQNANRKPALLYIREHIRHDMERLYKIISRLDCAGIDYAADDVVDEFNRYSVEYSIFSYMKSTIAKLKRCGRIRTSETYKSALNSFMMFRDNEDVMLDSITAEMIEEYELWLKERGVTLNTVSFYNRILRAVYNRAVDDGIINDRKPFRRVYTGVEKTVKRALPLSAVRRIKALDLTLKPRLDYARDMFMLSFYLRGMSFIDMAFLKKSALCHGHICYRRHKTGQLLTVKWTREMQRIINKYPMNSSEYMIPIIRNPCKNERSYYRNIAYNINYNLKIIASMLNLDFRLTLYVARHSWASAAKAKGVPLSIISEGMGHDSETTTQIYLASLDTSLLDRANSMIIRAVN